MTDTNLAKYRDLFIVNLRLLLEDIVQNVPDGKYVKLSAYKYIDAIDGKNANQTLDATKVSAIVQKVYTMLTLSSNFKLLEKQDNKIFQITQKKGKEEIVITIIPGINLDEAYSFYNKQQQQALWKYLENIFYCSTQLLYLVNPECVDKQILTMVDKYALSEKDANNIYADLKAKLPQSILNKYVNKEFDPFVGVGVTKKDYSVQDLMESTATIPKETGMSGLGGLTSMLGVDKMFDMSKLTEQLKNISKEDIDEATQNIKELLGNNVDSNTSDMINMMLHDITDELKKENLGEGNPISNIGKIAETVAQKVMPKIDPKKIDMSKIFNSTQNLAKNLADKQGNKIFGDKENPLAMLSNIMENQMKNMNGGKKPSNEDIKKQLDMMKKMGLDMSDSDMKKFQNMKFEDIMKTSENKETSNKQPKVTKVSKQIKNNKIQNNF